MENLLEVRPASGSQFNLGEAEGIVSFRLRPLRVDKPVTADADTRH